MDIDEVLEDSPLFEWQEFIMRSLYTDESLKFVQKRAFKDILTYQTSKMLTSGGALRVSPTVDEVQAWFQRVEAQLNVP